MSDPRFFAVPRPVALEEIAAWCGGRLVDPALGYVTVTGVAPLDTAGSGDLAFLDNQKYLGQLAATHATACLVHPRFVGRVPREVAAIETAEPYRAFATVLARLFPAAFRLEGPYGGEPGGISAEARVHPSARIEPGATIEPGAVIGARAEIGTGTVIGANTVIGHDVRIGRNGHVGANATIIHALIGNRVVIHGGVRIGQDGFGFAMGPRGHQKVPQIGRVVVQDDVEIGANTTIDRGANRDTIIGEGTKIDNLVQIAHNVVVGRHCVIVSQVGVSGSTTLEDFVVLAGQVGIAGHLRIGAGAQVGAQAGVMRDVAPRARVGGSPARSIALWAREIATLKRLAERSGKAAAGGQEQEEG
ncbi:UDP-3-O-(3-hydroxymyristoyl)glucosamine N-acyltransferase [Prosthecomicrobium sp. N25]|uniref:UDP-3-O-(3-hydroxymyristoyl)glucosamine N-acyltransferase n=1 Tax=Prosthecomicrobium sp. N25 TaxID=3129254 RepID=UPI003078265F